MIPASGKVGHSLKRSRYTQEQIAFVMRQTKGGTSFREVCRKPTGSFDRFYQNSDSREAPGYRMLIITPEIRVREEPSGLPSRRSTIHGRRQSCPNRGPIRGATSEQFKSQFLGFDSIQRFCDFGRCVKLTATIRNSSPTPVITSISGCRGFN